MKMNIQRLSLCFLLFCAANLLLAQDFSFQNRVAALSSTSPDAFAKGYFGNIGGGLTLQSRTRLSGKTFNPDGNALLAIGLGNPESLVGIDFRLNIFGIGNATGAPGNFGEGTIEFHLSRMLTPTWWVGAGVYDLAGWRIEPPNELRSLYLTTTKVFPLRADNSLAFSALYLTAGLGNGRFRTDEGFSVAEEKGLGVFASAALQVLPEGNFIVEWTGYNVFSGVSIFPFRKLPAQLVFGVDDIFNEKWKFIFAGSIGLNLFKNSKSDSKRFSGTTILSPPPPQTSRVN